MEARLTVAARPPRDIAATRPTLTSKTAILRTYYFAYAPTHKTPDEYVASLGPDWGSAPLPELPVKEESDASVPPEEARQSSWNCWVCSGLQAAVRPCQPGCTYPNRARSSLWPYWVPERELAWRAGLIQGMPIAQNRRSVSEDRTQDDRCSRYSRRKTTKAHKNRPSLSQPPHTGSVYWAAPVPSRPPGESVGYG